MGVKLGQVAWFMNKSHFNPTHGIKGTLDIFDREEVSRGI